MPYVWMLLSSFSFTIMGVFAHAAAASLGWTIIAGMRSFLVFLIVLALLWRSGGQVVLPGPRILWLRSLAGTVSLLCTFYALTHMPIANALTLTNMFPLWVALLSWPVTGERPGASLVVCLMLACAGVVLVENPTAGGWSAAAVVAILASVATAVAMMGLNRLGHLNPSAVVVHFSLVSLPFIAGVGYWGGAPAYHIAWEVYPMLLLLGTGVAAAVGQYCLTLAFTRGEARKVSIIGLCQVVFAWLCDRLIWDYPFLPMQALGVLCILGPTGYIMLEKAWRRAAQANRDHVEISNVGKDKTPSA
jgi:drug/metabolite transporter (DMT)-like permease